MMDLNTITNKKDAKVIRNIMNSDAYKRSESWYHNPSYIYDPRDMKNKRDFSSLMWLLLLVTFFAFYVIIEDIQRLHTVIELEETGAFPLPGTDIDIPTDMTEEEAAEKLYKKELDNMLCTNILGIAALLLFETYVIFNTSHAMFRKAHQPPSGLHITPAI